MEGRHQHVAHGSVFAGRHQRRGLAFGHLLRKTGATECTGLQPGCDLGTNLMAHQAKSIPHRGLKTLTQPRHRHTAIAQCVQHGPQP